MNLADIYRIDKELYEALGLTADEALQTRAFCKELLRLRLFNPKAFEAAILLLVSTLLAPREADGIDVLMQAKLDAVVKLQQQLGRLLSENRDTQLRDILEQMGLPSEDDIPKGKVN